MPKVLTLLLPTLVWAELCPRAHGAAALRRRSRSHTLSRGFVECLHSEGLHVNASARTSESTVVPNATMPRVWTGCMLYACNSTSECRDIHHTMALRVMAVLSCAKSQWFAFQGTLLGLMRNHSLSPNDKDMDIDLIVGQPWFDDFARPGSVFVRALDQLGYHVLQDIKGILRVCVAQGAPGMKAEDVQKTKRFRKQNQLYVDHYKYIDVYPATAQKVDTVNGSLAYAIGFNAKPFPAEVLLPLKSIDYKGHTINVPAHPEKVLTSLYGNWRQVCEAKHGEKLKKPEILGKNATGKSP